MKNNKGFGKFEVLTVIVLLMAVGAFLAYHFLGGASIKKLDTMRDSATSFKKAVVVNYDSFRNSRIVYLGEVIDEGLLKDIKNPVGKGYCSHSESYVETENDVNYVTLRCGDYLIDHVDVNSKKNLEFYQVSDWSEKKTNDDDESREFFNCKDNGKLVFDEYYEEFYFIYQVNKKFGTKYYFSSSVSKSCEVDKKTLYRTKKKLES